MDSTYRAIADNEDPTNLFKRAAAYFLDIRQLIQALPGEGSKIIKKNLAQQMASVVFGSNKIERIGLGQDETIRLCEAIFRGEDVDPENISPRYSRYASVGNPLLKLTISS